jgi:hypothetical protein
MTKHHGLLRDITDTLEIPELFSAKEVDMHVDPLLQRCYFREDTADVEERFNIAMTKEGSKTFAERRDRRYT